MPVLQSSRSPYMPEALLSARKMMRTIVDAKTAEVCTVMNMFTFMFVGTA